MDIDAFGATDRDAASPRPQQGPRAALYEQLVRELTPAGAVEHVLVADIAGRAASLEWWSAAASAARRTAENALAIFTTPALGAGPASQVDLVAAAACDAVDRAERMSLAQSRTFLRTVQTLALLQAHRTTGPQIVTVAHADDRFSSEASCAEYLVNWRRRHYRCQHCAARRAYYVAARGCLECAGCGAQAGLRVGTVMAGSALPLRDWFTAISMILDNPQIATRQLQRQLRLSRSATVRTLARRIRIALLADNRTELLAGLDRTDTEPESGASPTKKPVTSQVECHPTPERSQITFGTEVAPKCQSNQRQLFT